MEENDEKQDGEIIATSEFDKIVDDASLLKFCQAKNESQTKPTSQSLISLLNHINTRLLQRNIKLSIETCYELLIFCPLAEFYFMGYNHKTFLEQIDFGDNSNEKLNSLEQILNFIKSHKQSNENSDVQNYLQLIYFFLGFPIKTCSVNEFLEVMEFNFADSKIWDDGTIYLIIQILSSFIDKDKNQCSDVAKVLNDIFNSEFKHVKCDPDLINFIAELLTKLKKLHMDISIDCTKIINNYFTQLPPEKFDFKNWLVLLSGCKDNSVDEDAFNILIKNKQSLQALLPFSETCKQDEILQIKTKYGKYIFTPSLINFIRQKFNFDKNYNLEQVLKKNFAKENFIDGNDCDLSVIMYRLCFECDQCIPHKKEDIIKLFESTKHFLPKDYKTHDDVVYSKVIKNKFNDGLFWASSECFKNKIYEELDEFVQQIFREKEVLQKGQDNDNEIKNEIVNEQSNNSKSQNLTLEELKIIVLSNFEFAVDDQANGMTRKRFATLIPDNIDDKYYFRWCLELYKCNKGGISKEDFISCVKRYKFTDISDFNDFCMEINNKASLYDNTRLDFDCVSALLDACDRINFLTETSYSFKYMQRIVSEIRNQELTNKINEKFRLKLEPRSVSIDNRIRLNDNDNDMADNDNSRVVACSLGLQEFLKRIGLTLVTIIVLILYGIAIILTLGAVIWGPRLREERSRFGHNFADTDIGIGKNQRNSNRNSIPNQGDNLEENLNNKKNKPR